MGLIFQRNTNYVLLWKILSILCVIGEVEASVHYRSRCSDCHKTHIYFCCLYQLMYSVSNQGVMCLFKWMRQWNRPGVGPVSRCLLLTCLETSTTRRMWCYLSVSCCLSLVLLETCTLIRLWRCSPVSLSLSLACLEEWALKPNITLIF